MLARLVVSLAAFAVSSPLSCQQYSWALSPVNGHEYALTAATTWTSAENAAGVAGAHLATIRSVEEQQWIESQFGVAESLWIGLNDAATEGQFVWSSGELSPYRNWCRNEPNGGTGGRPDEDYVHLAAFPGQCTGEWNDAPDARSYRGLVERIPRSGVLVWDRVVGISARAGHGAVYDPVRQTGVYLDTEANGEQMELANGQWHLAAAAGGGLPPVRGYAIAPDPVRRRIVLFGGVTTSGVPAGTWFYDGNGWGSGGVPVEPPPRTRHAMAYDEIAQVVVLFGGRALDGTMLNDTWFLDANGWNYVPMSNPPQARLGHGMAFDSYSGRVMLIGGSVDDTGTSNMADVHFWDGTSWQAGPGLRDTRMDAAVGKAPGGGVLVVDGVGLLTTETETLRWNGVSWDHLGTRRALRSGASLVFDESLARTVLVGGTSFDLYLPSYRFGEFAEVETFDGTTWSRDPRSPPGPRMAAGMTTDTILGRFLVYGGSRFCTNLPESWCFDGDRWTMTPAGRTQTYGVEIVYDSTRQVVYAIGGEEDDCARDGMWTGPGQLPAMFQAGATIMGHQLAYDAHRDRVMMIGGWVRYVTNPGVLEYNGDPQSEWQLIVPSVQRWGTIAYMPTLQACVLQDSQGLWKWTGQDWQALGTAPGSMSHFDPTRQRMVFFDATHSRAWAWDGSNFLENSVLGPAPDRPGYGFYHPARRVFYYVGSESTDVWTLRHSNSAEHASTSPGCPGSNGVPAARTDTVPWIGDTFAVQFENVPSGAAVGVILGLSSSLLPGGVPLPLDLGPIGMPGCLLANSNEDLLLAPGGRWTMTIPNSLNLIGAVFFDQAIVLERSANAFGAILSDGSRGVIGVR